jgi:tRNA A-37 threonylcarbamoyl transferase component Bud32
MDGLELLGSGRDADVFRLGRDRVLRRYRNGADASPEAQIMDHVAAMGYPVPVVYDVDGSDLVMERLDGPTMAEGLQSGALEVPAAAKILADLHDHLHSLPPGADVEDPEDRVIHLDLHPQNVMLASRGPVVIDWRNATRGPADLDVALTAVIVAQTAVNDAHPRAAASRVLLSGFLQQSAADPARCLEPAVARRRADRNITAHEREQLEAAAALVRELT